MDFSLQTLTAAINELPHLPSQLGDSGLFEYAGVATTTVHVEKQGGTLSLVASKARGAPGSPIGRDSRNLRPFIVPHLPLNDALLADEVQGVRAFGSENAPLPVQTKLNEVMKKGMNRLDYTLEHMRVGALKGIVYDHDGTTVLHDFFAEFGVAQNTLSFALGTDTTKIRAKCNQVIKSLTQELGGTMATGFEAYCGADFWEQFITHKMVEATYLNQAAANDLRGSTQDAVTFGGITWRPYRGIANGADMIGANDSYVVPRGVPGLLIGRFAPADYIDTVNTLGLPIYAKGIEMRNGKGWDIEMQSNPIHILTRPRAVMKATL